MTISLYVWSAIIMLLFEYFVLLRVYQRSKTLEWISLIVAPLLVVISLYVSMLITKGKWNAIVLFIVLILFYFPLTLYGYEVKPNPSTLERMIIVASFGVVSVIVGKCISDYF